MNYQLQLKHLNHSAVFINCPQDSKGFVISQVIAQAQFKTNDIVFIANNDAEMLFVANQVKFFSPSLPIISFPAFDSLPYDRSSPKPQILAQRIKALFLLQKPAISPRLIITSVNALVQKTIAKNELHNIGLSVSKGDKVLLKSIANFLINLGYTRQTTANEVGEFAMRGGIVDLVLQQAGDVIGYRLDFFGEEIESIKIFDPITQLSYEEVKKLEILPTSELFFQTENLQTFQAKYRSSFVYQSNDLLYDAVSTHKHYPGLENWLPFFYQQDLVSIFDYFQQPVVFYDKNLSQNIDYRYKNICEYYQNRLHEQKIHPENLYNPILPELLYDKFNINNQKLVLEFSEDENIGNNNLLKLDLNIRPIPNFTATARINKQDPLTLFSQYIQAHQSKQNRFMVGYLQPSMQERLPKLLHDYQLYTQELDNFLAIQKTFINKISLAKLPLHFGFVVDDFFIIGEQALFGEKSHHQQSNKSGSQRLIEETLAITCNELVVHRDYGIGKFLGIHPLVVLGIKVDMLKILYANNDTLFVPVDDISLIYRYSAENPAIQLDKLGNTNNWKSRCKKTQDKIKLTAEELLKIAAIRKTTQGIAFQVDQHLYNEFIAYFGFTETPDQAKAILEVEQDLQSGKPMDRLICGDVGFGKTEVALRASAITCLQQNSMQVAIIAPTTILARQHYRNFSKRFAYSKIKIALLSRLTSPKEAKNIKEDLQKGGLDIVIGTHSLLADGIKFANLGLVIIDEEQHFGVAQKEKLKKLRNAVHLLTLSATPIPRTLQMSLGGVKDLSLIATPPLDRLAVRNFVLPYDSVIVREAIMREYNRSGQVFFVVPKIKDLQEIFPRLQVLLPELNIAVANGQIPGAKLEQIMNEFLEGKIDVLLSTTIIESGIDIANANTMIIYKAEHFGLAQLYQLRGRVGRGKTRGYCYFMLDKNQKTSKENMKKLEVMQRLDSLGVGFNVASSDLDIRGSGNLLGEEQSGHINEVGAEFYQQLLFDAVNQLKANDGGTENYHPNHQVAVKLGISMFIAEDYMPDLSLRMSFYKKIACLSTEQEYQNLLNELINRFGKPQPETINLLEMAILKHRCCQMQIASLELVNQGVQIGFYENKCSFADKILAFSLQKQTKIKILPQQKLLFFAHHQNFNETQKFALAHQVLQFLQDLA